MKRSYTIAGAVALSACLAGWAALAWAQPELGKGTPASPSPADPPRPEPTSVMLPPAGGSPEVKPPAAGPEDRYRPVPSGQSIPGLASGAPLPLGGNGPARTQSDLPVSSQGGPVPPVIPGPQGGPGARPMGTGVLPPPAEPGGLPQLSDPAPTGPAAAPAEQALPPTETAPSGTIPPGIAPRNYAEQAGQAEPGDEASSPSETGSGRQDSSVCLEWVGTPAAKIGQPMLYTLVVRNTSSSPVQQVQARVRIPNGLRVMATAPAATAEGVQLTWDLGAMQAREEKSLQLKMVAESKGDQSPQAFVSFAASSTLHIRVREPKLVLKASGTEKALVGDQVAFTLTASNPGDGSAEQVKIHALLSEGLEHARGNKIDFDIGNLAAGESRNVTLLCSTRSGGVQKCDATVEADGGLSGRSSASINVITPRLNLQVIGPALRYLGRKAIYTLRVTNPGDAPATNVIVNDVIPEGYKVLNASDGGRHDFSTRTVSWFVGEVGPRQSREVHVEVQAMNAGEFKHKATAAGARGLHAEAELASRIEGLSALLLEMVDTEDPIEVSSDTAYEVRITNTGSKMETNIKLMATIPDQMEFKNAQGPVRYHVEGKRVVFEPLSRLVPRADAIFRINVKAKEAGTVRFKIQVTSTNLVEPVIKMEATRIYSDSPEARPPATSPAGTPAANPLELPQ